MNVGSRRRWGTIAGIAIGLVVLVSISIPLFEVNLPRRGLGVSGFFSTKPGGVLLGFGLLTQLGDPWFLVFLAILVYLLGTERALVETPLNGAFTLAITFGGLAFTDLLKNLYGLPRPPGAGTVTVPTWLPATTAGLFRSLTTGGGFGFPSGHALGTTVVFGALASQLAIGSRRSRWAVATIAVGLVAFSRLVLGVHYLVDLVVGILAGAALLGTALHIGDHRPLRVFALASGIGLAAVVAAALSPHGEVWEAGQWLGASLGGGVAWYVVRPSRQLDLWGALAAGLPVAVLWGLLYYVSPPLLVTVPATAILGGFTVAAPTLVNRLRSGTDGTRGRAA